MKPVPYANAVGPSFGQSNYGQGSGVIVNTTPKPVSVPEGGSPLLFILAAFLAIAMTMTRKVIAR
jgi:hypothetical protein